MFQHPDLQMSLSTQRRNELIAEADRARLLHSIMRRRNRGRHTRNGRSET